MSDRRPRPGARVSSSALSAPTPRLSELVAASPGAELRGVGDTRIVEVAYRAQDVSRGALFFCVRGETFDGHRFAHDAVDRGAAALVVERWLDDVEIAQVRVPSVREAMGPVSAVVFGDPASSIVVVAVTGTNGKTTSTYLLESIFRAAGWTAGLIGTTGARIDGRRVALARTTPEAPDLLRLLARMREEGVAAVAMEASSHALAQHRVGGVRFRCALFTNLSQDHLDYHEDMEDYFRAKASLFEPATSARGVVNVDDVFGARLANESSLPLRTFGFTDSPDVLGSEPESDANGVSFHVGRRLIRSPLRGGFNVSNCLGAFVVARSLGIPDEVAAQGIEALEGVPGRVEPVDEGQDYLVMVDYAHTPDSIDNVLRAARPLASGRLIVVFGCGGDRDRGKRPLMGRAATSNADLTIVTSDNPRSEDPLAIIDEIVPGAKEGGGEYIVEPDRRLAIRLALGEASSGDVVVIAGKGHEPYQELAGRTIAFDDREVAAEELRAIGERT
jgi:UDP-N-acetylmuramoyl-L-alanyl-D-glutamate--2,6-diaminopimelate ligase